MIPHPTYGRVTTDAFECFLCGTEAGSITEEHVFPKWLLGRYDLWNARLDLLNETSITYKQLTIPCCAECNNTALSSLEAAISNAVSGGYESARALDPRCWYLWAGKLFFGLLRKELTLRRERRDPTAGNIVHEDGLKRFGSLHLFLQGIRGKHEFVDDFPYSVLICNVHDIGDGRSYFFQDNLAHMTLSIRMGEVGVIVSFEDCGLTASSYGKYVLDVNHQKLHPAQFDELYARTSYQVSRIESSFEYVTEFSVDGDRVAKTTVAGGIYLRDHSNRELADVLRAHLTRWIKPPTDCSVRWLVPPDLVPTLLTGEQGELLLRSLPEWQVDGPMGA